MTYAIQHPYCSAWVRWRLELCELFLIKISSSCSWLKNPLTAVLQGILSWLIRRCLSGLKIITALVGPRKSTRCFRTLWIQRVLSRLHTIAPDVRYILWTAPPEILAVITLFLHKRPFKYLAFAERQILIQKSLKLEQKTRLARKRRKQGWGAEGEEKARYPQPCECALMNNISKSSMQRLSI